MLTQLPETRKETRRSTFGTLVSVMLHGLLIAAAVHVTKRVAIAADKPVEVVMRNVARREDPPPVRTDRRKNATPPTTTAAPFERTFATPLEVPLDIPPVDLATAPTETPEFRNSPVARGAGVIDAIVPPGGTGDAYVPEQVEKMAALLRGTPMPAYPEMLRASGVEGEALVQFVVDTLGRVEAGSFLVVRATHEAFGTAVRTVLPRLRFVPAEIGGRRVRVLVQQPFAFALNR
ncbi:MAG TPA: TonB family protein [Gemmatimonadaceae bacterium]|nr:TonB family protein [Gemmatimonadaceae bacterium]